LRFWGLRLLAVCGCGSFAVGLPTATRCLEISSVLPEEISARRSKLPRVSGALQMKSVSQKAAFLKSKE